MNVNIFTSCFFLKCTFFFEHLQTSSWTQGKCSQTFYRCRKKRKEKIEHNTELFTDYISLKNGLTAAVGLRIQEKRQSFLHFTLQTFCKTSGRFEVFRRYATKMVPLLKSACCTSSSSKSCPTGLFFAFFTFTQ